MGSGQGPGRQGVGDDCVVPAEGVALGSDASVLILGNSDSCTTY